MQKQICLTCSSKPFFSVIRWNEGFRLSEDTSFPKLDQNVYPFKLHYCIDKFIFY